MDATTTLAFQSTGLTFAVAGMPLAGDAALVEAGTDLRVTLLVTLDVGYCGRLASYVQDHALRGRLPWKY